jgi:hypothetical protein
MTQAVNLPEEPDVQKFTFELRKPMLDPVKFSMTSKSAYFTKD